jgi:importin-7
VYLKHRVNRGWATGEDIPLQNPIPVEEKGPFRERLLPVLASSPSSVCAQLIPILQKILQYDFPANWPDFMPITLRLLSTQDSNSVFTGLQCMLSICRTYRFKASDGRDEFGSIIQVSFDHLLNIGNRLVEETSLEAGEMLRMVMKCFKHAIYVCWLDSKR